MSTWDILGSSLKVDKLFTTVIIKALKKTENLSLKIFSIKVKKCYVVIYVKPSEIPVILNPLC